MLYIGQCTNYNIMSIGIGLYIYYNYNRYRPIYQYS